MGEIKPWMRRAAREIEALAGGENIDADEAAEAIAAHAPPVEEIIGLVRPLRTISAVVDAAVARYDDWLKREEATDGAR